MFFISNIIVSSGIEADFAVFSDFNFIRRNEIVVNRIVYLCDTILR